MGTTGPAPRARRNLISPRFAADLRRSLQHFIHNQSTGGILLMLCAVVALVVANAPALGHLSDFWHIPFGFSLGGFRLEMSLLHWVNDGLMAVFFFVVGLEIKREMMAGELCSFKQAALPVFAAAGGMLVPALIYAFFNRGTPGAPGWGIPMATDIAFALGVLSLLGNRVPLASKVFLTALAIVDDLGAILVLAVFYPSHSLHPEYLFYAGIVVALLLAFNRSRVRHPLYYLLPGLLLWYFVYRSGIHATVAGVVLALTVPGRTYVNEVRFSIRMRYFLNRFRGTTHGELNVLASPEQQHLLHRMEHTIREISPLMHRFESALHPWVTFLIMPVFALANAGVAMDGGLFGGGEMPALVPGIFFGLLVGKPVGIFCFSWLAVRLRIASLPSGTGWLQILGLGVIAGIGFTMSIFIDNLAFADRALVDAGKAAVLVTSAVAAVAGLTAVALTSGRRKETESGQH